MPVIDPLPLGLYCLYLQVTRAKPKVTFRTNIVGGPSFRNEVKLPRIELQELAGGSSRWIANTRSMV
jgi:hypothetical protein